MCELHIGQRFENFDVFTAAVDAYGLATNAVFSTIDSKRNGPNQYIKLGCKHYGKPRCKSEGIRPHQKTFKKGCPVYINGRRANGCVVINRMNLGHANHDQDPVLAALYPERRQLAAHERKTVENLVSYNISPAILQGEVRKLTGKSINTQDLANLRYKMRTEARGTLNKVEEAIAVLIDLLNKDPNAIVVLGTRIADDPEEKLHFIDLRSSTSSASEGITDSESVLMFIFIQTGSMRETFARYPEVLLMDNTYNITETRMPLNLCMVMDSYGCGRVVSYTFMGNEKQNTIESVLKCLKQGNPEAAAAITTVVIDKDLNESVSVTNVLGPHVNVEICLFHAQRALKEGTKDIKDVQVRESTRKILQKIIYSKSEEEYVEQKQKLKEVAPEETYQYFLKNWDSMKEAWVLYEKLFTPNFGNLTTNRVENKNRHLKEVLKTTCSLAESIRGILMCHENKERSVAVYNYEAVAKSSYVVGNQDTDVAEMVSVCTPFAAKLMISQIPLMEGSHRYTSDGSTCECIFYKSLHLPCRHIFLERKRKGVPKFQVEDVPDRWLKLSANKECVIDATQPVVITPATLNPLLPQRMYKEVFSIAKDICHILCRRGRAQFESGKRSLMELRDHFMAGDDVVMASVSITDDVEMEVPEPSTSSIAPSLPQMSAPSTVTSASDSVLGLECDCGELAARRTVTRGVRKGEHFYACGRQVDKCGFMHYDGEPVSQNGADPEQERIQKICSGIKLLPVFKVRGRPRGSTLTVIGTKRRKKNGDTGTHGQTQKKGGKDTGTKRTKKRKSKKYITDDSSDDSSDDSPDDSPEHPKASKGFESLNESENTKGKIQVNGGKETGTKRAKKRKSEKDLTDDSSDDSPELHKASEDFESFNESENIKENSKLRMMEHLSDGEEVVQSAKGKASEGQTQKKGGKDTGTKRTKKRKSKKYITDDSSDDSPDDSPEHPKASKGFESLNESENTKGKIQVNGGKETGTKRAKKRKSEKDLTDDSSDDSPELHKASEDFESFNESENIKENSKLRMMEHLSDGEEVVQSAKGKASEVYSKSPNIVDLSDYEENVQSQKCKANKVCVACGLEAGDHKCEGCGGVVHAISPCSIPAKGAAEGYGQLRQCRDCSLSNRQDQGDPFRLEPRDCKCDIPAVQKTTLQGPNRGRRYWSCSKPFRPVNLQCRYFRWIDDPVTPRTPPKACGSQGRTPSSPSNRAASQRKERAHLLSSPARSASGRPLKKKIVFSP